LAARSLGGRLCVVLVDLSDEFFDFAYCPLSQDPSRFSFDVAAAPQRRAGRQSRSHHSERSRRRTRIDALDMRVDAQRGVCNVCHFTELGCPFACWNTLRDFIDAFKRVLEGLISC
jgi:hypothetical protein